MNKKILLLIIFLAFILRLYKLGEVPLGLNWDEVSNAYNAYSILKTGRDEYGNFFPLTNRSFDDYKPPIYMYLNVPTVAIFDLSPLAARLPSAILGTLTVIVIYFLSKFLLQKESIAQVSALLLAISPWHIQFSRVGFEANVGLFFTVLSFTMLLSALIFQWSTKFKAILLVGTSIGAILSLYSYHSQRIFMPLMLIATLFIFKKELMQIPKKILAAAIVILIVSILPVFFNMPKETLIKRLQATSFEPRQADSERAANLIIQDKRENFDLGNILHNRRVVFAQTYFKNYLSHFDPNFLFTKGDNNPRHHIEGVGMLYIFQIPLVLIGIYLFIKERTKQAMFVLSWLMLSPIPSITGDANPHAVRSLTMIISLLIISARALINIYNFLSTKRAFLTISLFFFTFSFFLYLHNYYQHYPKQSVADWQYHYSLTAKKTEEIKDQFSKIKISENIQQAYIFWLFETKYDPELYQKDGSNLHFDKYNFKSQEPTNSSELFVSDKLDNSFEIIETIYSPEGEKAIEIGHKK